MSCQHPSTQDELPCPWPGCPDGTPQQTIVLLRGDEGSIRARRHHSMTIESSGGAEMWRRREVAGGWEWVRADASRG